MNLTHVFLLYGAIEFIVDIDESFTSGAGYDTDFRYLKAGIIETVIRRYVNLHFLNKCFFPNAGCGERRIWRCGLVILLLRGRSDHPHEAALKVAVEKEAAPGRADPEGDRDQRVRGPPERKRARALTKMPAPFYAASVRRYP